MPLGTEVDLGLGHIVLDGEPASPSPRKGHSSPLSFSLRLLWPNGRPCQLRLSSCNYSRHRGCCTAHRGSWCVLLSLTYFGSTLWRWKRNARMWIYGSEVVTKCENKMYILKKMVEPFKTENHASVCYCWIIILFTRTYCSYNCSSSSL